MEEMKRLTESVGTGYTGEAWIGLKNGTSLRWQWSSGEGDTRYINWDNGQPNFWDNDQHCTDFQSNGAWNDYSCSTLWYFICYTAQVTWPGTWDMTPCDEKHPFVCYDDNLILVNSNTTWNEALNYCRTYHSDLVSVHNEEIQYWVSRMAEKASTDHVWLGLRFSCSLNFWFWVSAENVCYQNWAPNNTSNSNLCGTTGAVQSKDPHYWVSLPETKELNFICSKYPIPTGKRTVVRLTVRTDGEIKDPEFSSHLLMQLQEKLIRAGMSESTRLQWRTQHSGQIFNIK
ncbi:macrophage mannose receptor 1-like [Paramormyrops kingsleyae]|uniref:macrophage mannose receptor 1-like n=1 Tax=Paramormyrops kingsleyae TaxID=1676925 RepID=UPI003B972D6C